MDELNQTQNQNMPPMPQMPPVPSQMPARKKSSLFLIVVLALAAVGAFAWWYIGQMGEEPLVLDQPRINEDAREDARISRDLGSIDTGNLDAEFQIIDNDLNNL